MFSYRSVGFHIVPNSLMSTLYYRNHDPKGKINYIIGVDLYYIYFCCNLCHWLNTDIVTINPGLQAVTLGRRNCFMTFTHKEYM